MIDIGKYFPSSKKRDLSDIFKKKIREAPSSSSYSGHDVFEEDLDSASYRSILFDCLKNLKSKVTEKFSNTNTLKKKNIKGEKQLTDITEAVNFISEKFNEFEVDRKLKAEIIKNLLDQVSVLLDDLQKWKHKLTNRHNILVGINFIMG